MKKSEFLKRAWSFIDEPRKWITGSEKQGDTYCSIGALKAAYHQLMDEGMSEAEARRAYALARHELVSDVGSIIGYNDNTSYSKVSAWWKKVIDRASKEETPEIKVELKPQQPRVVRATAQQAVKEPERELA